MSMLQKYVDYNTRGMRPPRVREWYRRHPVFTLVFSLTAYAVTLYYIVKGIRKDIKFSRDLAMYKEECHDPTCCHNPECPQAGNCGGECAKLWFVKGGGACAWSREGSR